MALLNRIVAFLTALVALITNILGIAPDKTVKKVDDFKVTSYIRGGLIQNPDNLYKEDFDIITHIILFECATFDAQGNVHIDEKMTETALTNIRNAVGDRDVHISLNLLGPWGETDSDVWEEQMEAQSDAHNKAFESGVLEDNIISVLEKYGFNGVHFDYEYPISLKAWHYYNKFLVSMNKALGDNYTLGVAGNAWNLKFSAASIKAIDTFELMAYDYNDAEGRHATYEDVVASLRPIGLHGIPLKKVNIGLAFYSRPTDMSTYWYGYNGCYEGIDENGWYHCPETGKDFWFNTPDVIEAKTDYAINYGYGGVMIWHYNCDLPSSHEDSLLRAVGTSINNNY